MKFGIKQEKFQELLEKLMMRDIYPSSIISTKNGAMFSIQRAGKGRALRYAKFNNSYFDFIDNSSESIEFDVEKNLPLIKEIPAGMLLIIETKDGKFTVERWITDDKGKPITKKGCSYLNYKEPEGEVKDSLPFEMKDGVPLVGEGKVPLSTVFTINLTSLKEITTFGKTNTLKTEFYKFLFETADGAKKLAMRVGDLHAFSTWDVAYPISEIKSGDVLDVIFTYGIPQIADIYRQNNVTFQTSTNCPAFIFESCDQYILGMLIPPYTPE